jgi:hypothetical protein
MKRQTLALIGLLVIASLFPISKKVEVDVAVKVKQPIVVQTEATWEQKKANKIMASQFASAAFGWDKRQIACVHLIFMKESKYDHLAKNQQGSSAFGIAQMLKEKSKDPAIQILKAYKYIKHRYGTPCSAWVHHRKGWY